MTLASHPCGVSDAGMPWGKMRLYNTIQDNTIQHNTRQYYTIQCDTIRYYTIQHDTIQYNTILYNAIQYNTIQYDIIRHDTYNTIQYDTIRYFHVNCIILHETMMHHDILYIYIDIHICFGFVFAFRLFSAPCVEQRRAACTQGRCPETWRRWRMHDTCAKGRLREGRQGKAETHKRYKDMRACIHTISYYTFEYIYIYIYMFIFMRLQ